MSNKQNGLVSIGLGKWTFVHFARMFKLGTMGIKAVKSHMKSEKQRKYAGIRRDMVPMEFYMSVVTASAAPAGPQTGNVRPNNT